MKTIRATEEKLGRRLGILADMQGPKFRIGALEAPIDLVGQLCLHLPDADRRQIAVIVPVRRFRIQKFRWHPNPRC